MTGQGFQLLCGTGRVDRGGQQDLGQVPQGLHELGGVVGLRGEGHGMDGFNP